MGVAETKTATADLYRVIRNYQTRLAAARAYQNDALTPDGLSQARGDLAERSRQDAAAKAARLLQTARDGLAFAQSRLDAVRPKLDPNDVAQLTRTQQAWQMIIQPMRDAGKSWFDIAKVADQDVMLALQRFGEQRIKLDDPVDAPLIIGNLRTALDRRLAEIHPDPDARQLFADARAAGDHEGIAEYLANAADSRRPEQLVGAIIGAKQAAHQRGIDLPREPAPTAEQLDLLVRSTHPVAAASAVI